ncbi:MAG TPA: hypothetical protein VMX12_05330, partial [Acidimicrobiia bacterium]|nr:hypothetical protein [Acidimicrobiia bacterium]
MEDNRLELAGAWKRSVGGREIDFVTVPGSFAPLGQCTLEVEFDRPWPAGEGRVFLVTEGVLARATFVLNGREIGSAGPWATYRFELPRDALQARNVLQAHVRDIVEAFGPTPGRRFDAGLVRRIWIERRCETFLADVAFRAELADDLSSAACTVSVELDGPEPCPAEITLAERDT